VSTWVLDRDPWAAVQSDDRGAGYDRYQVMNPPAGKYDVGDNGTGIIKRECIAAMVRVSHGCLSICLWIR